MKQQLLSLMIAAVCCWVAAGAAGCRSAPKPAPAEPVPVPVQSFARQWVVNVPVERGDKITEVHVRENTVYCYSQKHQVFAIDRTSGQLQYIRQAAPANEVVLFPPIVLKDYTIFPSGSGINVCTPTGRFLKTVQIGSAVRSPGVGNETLVYIGSAAGRVAAVDVAREYAHVRWEIMTFGLVTASPALYEGALFVPSHDGRVYAVTTERDPVWPGLERSSFQTGGELIADLRADQFGVYVASTDSKLYCLNRQNGRLKWQYFAGYRLDTPPAVTDKAVYQYVPRSGVVAIDKENGKANRDAKWVSPRATQFLAVDERYVYLLQDDHAMIAVERESGKTAFKSRRSDFRAFGENTRDGIIYAATTDGQIMAIEPILRPGTVGEIVQAPQTPQIPSIAALAMLMER